MRLFAAFMLLIVLAAPAGAQQALNALDHDAYDVWNHIEEHAISDDGRWVLYSLGPVDGDAALHVVRSDESRRYVAERGEDAAFSADGGFVVFLVQPPRDSVRAAKLAETKKEDLPKDALGLLALADGSVTRIPNVTGYKIPEENGGYVAYLLDKSEAVKDTTSAGEAEAGEEEETAAETAKKKDKAKGTPLVLRTLATGAEQRFEDVTDYRFTEDGRWLAFAASNEDGSADGVFAVETATGAVTPVMTGEGAYTHLAFDEAGTQLAFLANRDDYAADEPAFTLYHWAPGQDAAQALATEGTAGIPEGWWVGEHGALDFSDDGTRLFFGTVPRPDPTPEDTIPDDERVKVDVWSWTDPYLMTMQIEQKDAEMKRTYRAVVHLGDGGRVVQLATQDVPDVEVAAEGEGRVALGISNLPYRQLVSWDWPGYYDAYVIDVETGERRRVLEQVQDRPDLSPEGGYLTWWDREALAWFALATDGGTPVNLTAGVPHAVHYELHDWPYRPNAYGDAGWTEGDAAFLVYDKHDVWAADPRDGSARNVTDGYGRAQNLRFRYVDLDDDEEAIDPDDLLLSAFDYATRAEGFYRDAVGSGRPPERLVMMDYNFSTPEKADEAGRLLFTRESYQDFPDLWTSDLDFEPMRRLSDANPQQAEYRWGTVEQVSWTSLDGILLDGLLYKPEGFDPAQQYPMMVYFYERNSDNLHRHWAPEPHRSIINFTFYASRGYLVFVPDIPYKIGYPGESAVNAVLPGVTMLLDTGFVDRDRVGVQGHSWGGYQSAYLITESNLFAAAESGAPVSNMISAYGGIRWGSGMSRMFQYEQTQSRIGGSLWEQPLRYIENSPIFTADKIETPLLIMHNDHDGAVPWYQGIELFVALRRLGKPVWMINYNDEPHWPTTYPNKRDWAIRMQQFFDHYLMDAPAPAWMTEGVPATQKGRTLGLEPVEPAPASSQ